jgi:hypothetical protein
MDLSMCASSDATRHADQINWPERVRRVRRLQACIAKGHGGMHRRATGLARAGLCHGLSRMRRKSHVRF